jgi:hypothetical protein
MMRIQKRIKTLERSSSEIMPDIAARSEEKESAGSQNRIWRLGLLEEGYGTKL